MTQVCPVSIKCPCDDSPIGNYSAEAPDKITFNSIGFPIYNPYNPLPDDPHDPLNPTYTAAGCEVVCVSTVSQEAADDCAAVDAYLCQHGGRNPPPDVPVFYNDQQTCAFPCPDGTLFVWTVIAGAVVTGNQDLSNRIAASIACQRAAQRRLCLPSLSGACLNQPFSQTVTVTTGVPPLTFTITSGALPPGLTMTPAGPRSVIIAGTPTMAGAFAFTLTVQDPGGNYFSKHYNFQVMGINPDTLPEAFVGAPYNQTLTATGGVAPFTFNLELGDLPDGLTLADDGTISGTPTRTGSFDVTISVTDSRTLFCTKDYTIAVGAGGFQICGWSTVVLPNMTVPAAWAASAQPAWNGIFDLQTTYGAGIPLYYFINQSIGGKKTAASEAPDYPNGPWANNDGFTQMFWTGAVWQVYIGPCDGGFNSPDFLTYTGPATFGDPTGNYTRTTQAGTAVGPATIVVQKVGSVCCPDWKSMVWTAPTLNPGLGGGSCSASAATNTAQATGQGGTISCSQVTGMTGTLNYDGPAFDAFITVNVTSFLSGGNTVAGYFEVLQDATTLATFWISDGDGFGLNRVFITDADGARTLDGQMPGTFKLRIHGISAVASVFTIRCSNGSKSWIFVCNGAGSLNYNLSVSC